MATGAQAIARIAEATGILPATVSRAARILREADPLLWPEAGKGGGKRAAHVEPRHLVNLVLALAVADPVTRAREAVLTYRNLTHQVIKSFKGSDDENPNQTTFLPTDEPTHPFDADDPFNSWGAWLFGATLGDGLENFIIMYPRIGKRNALLDLDCLNISLPESISNWAEDAGLTVTLTIGQTPAASVCGWRAHKGIDLNERMKSDLYSVPPEMEAEIAFPKASKELRLDAAFERETKIPFGLLKVLGDLWSDTLVHQPGIRVPLSLPAPAVPNAEHENENAGLLPRNPAPDSCGEPQSSASRIVIIGRPCPRSLQRA